MPYQGYQDYFESKLVISVATTGGMHGKEANPNLPEQPDEILADLGECRDAGASIVHLHARDEEGNPTKDPSKFQELADRIREEYPDLLVNITTGGPHPPETLIRPVVETTPAPELATIDLGPISVVDDRVAENTRDKNVAFARRMADAGVKPELEVFSPGHLTESQHLVEEGLIDPPYWFTLIFGMRTGTLPRPRNLINFVDNLPEDAEWQCMAIGRHQLPLTTMAIVLGGHVRVGMEDNVYYRQGELAESNAQLVRRTARIADELERPVATPAETCEMLGL